MKQCTMYLESRPIPLLWGYAQRQNDQTIDRGGKETKAVSVQKKAEAESVAAHDAGKVMYRDSKTTKGAGDKTKSV